MVGVKFMARLLDALYIAIVAAAMVALLIMALSTMTRAEEAQPAPPCVNRLGNPCLDPQPTDEEMAATCATPQVLSVLRRALNKADQFSAQATAIIAVGKIKGHLPVRQTGMVYSYPCVAITRGVHCIPGMVGASCSEFFTSTFYMLDTGKVEIVTMEHYDARRLSSFRGVK
jgi:hypothetical protein